MKDVLGSNCSSIVEAAFNNITSLWSSSSGKKAIQQAFNVCQDISSFELAGNQLSKMFKPCVSFVILHIPCACVVRNTFFRKPSRHTIKKKKNKKKQRSHTQTGAGIDTYVQVQRGRARAVSVSVFTAFWVCTFCCHDQSCSLFGRAF